MRRVMCPSWEYFNCASCDHSTRDRNTGETEAIRDVTMSRRTKSSYLLWTFSFGPGFLLISRGKTRPFSFSRTAWSQTSFSTSDAFAFSFSFHCPLIMSLFPVMHSGTSVQSSHSNKTANSHACRLKEGALHGHHDTEQWLTCESKSLVCCSRFHTPPTGRMGNRA